MCVVAELRAKVSFSLALHSNAKTGAAISAYTVLPQQLSWHFALTVFFIRNTGRLFTSSQKVKGNTNSKAQGCLDRVEISSHRTVGSQQETQK